ncbi:hypothetical protein [Mesorhizobium sp. 43Arga]
MAGDCDQLFGRRDGRLVDSTLPNTAGTKPSVVIKGDLVRATIR